MAKSQALERIMMLAVYYTAATGKDRIPRWAGSITAPFRSGIIRMSDPKMRGTVPRTDPSVYLGSETALAALLSPKFFWEPLTMAQKENVLTFLQELAHMPSYDNNHHLFHMLPVPLLERHGRPSNRADLTEMLKRILSWYRGDGWFIDGVNCGFDHYNFWGFQLYTNAVCHLDKAWRGEFGARFRVITSEFLQNARFFFCRDGGPIPWGRSLSYRFADVSAIGWAHVNGANPLAPGLARRIASGCVKYFWNHGALDENGVLELGYHAANAVVAEDYLTDGIDYFAAQGLACLLIPETDPFWTDTELPLPADRGGGRLAPAGRRNGRAGQSARRRGTAVSGRTTIWHRRPLAAGNQVWPACVFQRPRLVCAGRRRRGPGSGADRLFAERQDLDLPYQACRQANRGRPRGKRGANRRRPTADLDAGGTNDRRS